MIQEAANVRIQSLVTIDGEVLPDVELAMTVRGLRFGFEVVSGG
jgi:hypothetical protein